MAVKEQKARGQQDVPERVGLHDVGKRPVNAQNLTLVEPQHRSADLVEHNCREEIVTRMPNGDLQGQPKDRESLDCDYDPSELEIDKRKSGAPCSQRKEACRETIGADPSGVSKMSRKKKAGEEEDRGDVHAV